MFKLKAPRAILILCSLVLLTSCGKKRHSRPVTPPEVSPTISLEQWTGRTDYTESTWQIKSQP